MTTVQWQPDLQSPTAATPGRHRAALIFAVGLVVLVGVFLASLAISGTAVFSPAQVWNALLGHGDPLIAAAVDDLRLPRAIGTVLIGASLAVAGCLIQAVTRNPIVEPSIIGVNSGAALAVAVVTFVGGTTLQVGGVTLMPFVAFVGAAAAAGAVYALVSGIDATPGRIALAGVSVAILANALVTGTVMLKDSAVYLLLHYLVGGVDGIDWSGVLTLLPYTVIGLVGAVALSRGVTVLEMGDDVARGLGQNVGLIRAAAVLLVVVLAGASVAVAGPIAMVGLMVPHMCRWLVGGDYRTVIPLSMVLGAALLIVADVVSRFVAPPTETPVGVLTALIGTPYFIYLARRGKGAV